MQFQVPQFIDVEPKIVGPMTLRQFIFVASGFGASVVFFFLLATWLALILSALVMAVALALAFAKMNGQPLQKVMVSIFKYFWQPRYFLWRRAEEKPELPEVPKIKLEREKRPPLKDLFLKLTTTTRPIEKREKPSKFLSFLNRPVKEQFEAFRKTTGERDKARRVDYR